MTASYSHAVVPGVAPPGLPSPAALAPGDGPASGSNPAAVSRFAARVALAGPVLARAVPPAIASGRNPVAALYARGTDPLTGATQQVHSAIRACEDAVDAVIDDPDLREAFEYALRQLDLGSRMLAQTQLSAPPDDAALVELNRLPDLTDSPHLREPVATSREPVYGLRSTLSGALSLLAQAVRDLGAAPRRGAAARSVLPQIASLAASARRVERVADVVVAHVLEQRLPSTPQLPGVGGDVELYAFGRAVPYRRASMRARVRFTPGRVEVTTATGRVSVGQDAAIGSLLWVAPGETGALTDAFDPTEQLVPPPEQDELGTIHVLDTAGRSLLSLTVADWASQPTTVVDQALVDGSIADVPLGAARGILALEAIGFTRGATTIGVELRRGLAHPPEAEGSLGRLRPAPDRPAYPRGDGKRPRAQKRRAARRRFWNLDLGPALPGLAPLRAVAPWLLAVAPFVIWPGGGRNVVQLLVLVAALCCLLEPYVSWAVRWVRDQAVPAKARATYRAGSGVFAPRLDLRAGDLVLSSRSGHRTRLPGPTDGDLGIVRIVRLRSTGGTWGFALADARWRWRAVLPAQEWAPNGNLAGLERFAAAVGLELADQDVDPLPRLATETAAPGEAAATRWIGPWPRALVVLGIVASPAALVALVWGPQRSMWLALAELLLTYGGAGVVALLTRWRLRGPARA
ncbi:hypothetical protein [Salana multivorans]|uniref:hypothetical protein n=1 Tax=Salana multivorans TaxID=120377 RepID=UPI002491BE4B|nr:hypothetical protein [Salana multivorans]